MTQQACIINQTRRTPSYWSALGHLCASPVIDRAPEAPTKVHPSNPPQTGLKSPIMGLKSPMSDKHVTHHMCDQGQNVTN
jgi:hypothetical protein